MTRRQWHRGQVIAVGVVAGTLLIGSGAAVAATMLLSTASLTTGDSAVSVPKFATTLSATPSPTSATAGSPVSNVAALSGGTSNAGGTITFKLFGPGNTACTGSPVASPSAAVAGNGSYTASPAPAPTATGTYLWSVGYGGDSRNDPAPSPTPSCGNGGQVVIVASNRMHVGSIVGLPSTNAGTNWKANAQVLVLDASGDPLSGVVVSVGFSNGGSTASCTTAAASGKCTATSNPISDNFASTTVTVTNLAKAAYTYDASADVGNPGTANQ